MVESFLRTMSMIFTENVGSSSCFGKASSSHISSFKSSLQSILKPTEFAAVKVPILSYALRHSGAPTEKGTSSVRFPVFCLYKLLIEMCNVIERCQGND